MRHGIKRRPLVSALAALMLTWSAVDALAHEQGATAVAPEVERALRAAFPATRIDKILPSEFSGLYELHMGKNVAYGTPKSRYLLVGHIYDTSAGEDVTQRRIDALTPNRTDWSDLPLDAAIRHGMPGGVKVAVYTDPDCPYCRKLAAAMPKIEGVEWYELLYPLAELHPAAPAKARAILCHSDRPAALQAALQDQALASPAANCDAQKDLRRIEESARKLGVAGTPTLIREDGAMLRGMASVEALQAWVRATPPVVTARESEARGAKP